MTAAPSIHWQKFFDRFSEIDSLSIPEWKEAHLLAYFCHLYKSLYGVSYTWDLGKAKAPSKSYEMYRIRSLQHMISSDPQIIKDYLDWVFESKIKPSGKKITSLALVVDQRYASEYKFQHLGMDPSRSVGRATLLPTNYQQIADRLCVPVRTYGDLAFLHQTDGAEELLLEMQKAGFDPTILERVS